MKRLNQADGVIAERMKEQTDALSQILHRALGANLDFVNEVIADEPPLAPRILSARVALVEEILQRTAKATWIGLTASTGLGKTQACLARSD